MVRTFALLGSCALFLMSGLLAPHLSAQTLDKPVADVSYVCQAQKGKVVERQGDLIVSRADDPAEKDIFLFSVGAKGSGCHLLFRSGEFGFYRFGKFLEFNSYDKNGPVPMNFVYSFQNRFVGQKLKKLRLECTGYDNVKPRTGYTATDFSLCIERRSLESISATATAIFFLDEPNFRRTLTTFASDGEIYGIGVEIWDRRNTSRYSEYIVRYFEVGAN